MPTLEELVSHPPQLPVTRALGDIAAATRPGGCAVITAPPGTGKTTLLPPAVAVALARHDASAGRVLVTQPRRVAARAAARRIARLLGEEVGGQVGYSVRGDSRVSERTRVEMVTPGVALRRLQRDPELPGVSALIVDEFHERDLDTDLALAFALDARSALRDDLFVALTSATLEASRTVDFLRSSTGEEPALVDIPGDIFPLELRYAPPPRGVEAVGAIGNERVGVRREYLAHVARTVEETVAATEGSVLVFLPGVGEIETVRSNLHLGDIPVLTLHGQLSAAEQDRALSPASGRRVILSTSIAESSLTVPGVSVVVDAGLAREPRFDAGRGLSSLVTVPAALARLEQRAGRAARTGPGIAVRVMDAVDVARRPAQSAPGIATQDLTDARLQVAAWGTPVEELALLDAPPAGTWEAAGQRLSSLGAIDEAGAATALGRTLASLPLDPPLGRALLASSAVLGASKAARFVALLSEDVRVPGADLGAWERRLGRGGASGASGAHAQAARVKETQARLERLAKRLPNSSATDALAPTAARQDAHGRTREDELALTCALAYPEWIARRRPGSMAYILAGGVGAELPQGSPLEGQEWLAVASIDRAPASRHARILAAVPLAEEDALAAGAALLETRTQASIDKGALTTTRTRTLGAIPLKAAPASSLSEEEATALVADHLAAHGLGDLGWGKEASSLRERMRVLHEVLGDPWPDVSDEALARTADQWLIPWAKRLANGGSLSKVSMLDALRSMLPWPDAARLDELAPEKMPIPSGGTRPIDWSGAHPVLTLRVQQAFGWTDTPRLVDGRVPLVLHLTDPAGRPAAVTSDLTSFWAGPYRDVRAQLRGRYPKHPWPEDTLHAEPTNRAKRRG
ncbi:ATP-dependent helicase HrpB [Actinomyces sp. HPA0247]|uniref:ATP-dependent helicase HrpB n=1 Tax=Actinomyces sp. HPA0247 TaxID=1203556 RepID=UPI00055627C4|nr:ATP-dependent helicase HrpB [Actinomyces sp. HPA0247]